MSVAVARGLSRRFGDKLAVDSLDLEVERGEVLALLGHNGAGKTTTVRLFNGVLTPTAGSVSVFGLSPFDAGSAVRARTGVLTESQSLEERLSARDNLRYYAALYGYPPERVEHRVSEVLSELGLTAPADQRVVTFSRGMKQRLALARALLHEPELLFLDEPTAGLDPVAAQQVMLLIARQSREADRSVLMCTHNLAEAQQVADRVAVLRDGRLVALGTPAELVAGLGERAGLKLEVVGSDAGKAAEILATFRDGAPAVGGAPVTVEREAPGTLLLHGVARDEVPRLVRELVAAAVSVMAIEPIQPTLRDVYFSIYGDDDFDAEGSGVEPSEVATP